MEEHLGPNVSDVAAFPCHPEDLELEALTQQDGREHHATHHLSRCFGDVCHQPWCVGDA